MTSGSPVDPSSAGARSSRPVFFAWLLLSVVTSLPYVRAALAPPPGSAFVGTFHWINDVYNYVSFVQQAEDGRFFFENKVVTERHARVLVNLEWWLVGRISAALGRRPFLAYRVMAVAACLALLMAVDRWLRRGGLPDSHRLAALLLVGTGGGLGGLLFRFTDLPVQRCLDLANGLYPFIELLSNPHWAVATALLLWALWAFANARDWSGDLKAVGLGTVLGLVRPYDLVLLVGIRALAVLFSTRPRTWFRRLSPLAGLAPVSLYNGWVFFRSSGFAVLSNPSYASPNPPPIDFAWALGPPALLALLWLWKRRAAGPDEDAAVHLWMWILIGLLIAIFKPISFWQQFLVGLGLPLLALAALGLSCFPPRATLAVVAALSSLAVMAVLIVLEPDPHWYVPAARLDAAVALRRSCRPGDIVLAPPDISLYAYGLTACKAYLAHEIVPDYSQREEQMVAFYGQGDPGIRADFLDRNCVTHVVLPGNPGTIPRAWLGESTSFRQLALLGRSPSVISIYGREAALPCRPRRE